MTSVAEFAAKCDRISKTGGRVTRNGVDAGALAGKNIVLANMAADGVRPGVKLRTAGRVNVRYKTFGYVNATAILGMTGPAHLVNNPTRGHYIGAKGAASRAGHRGAAGFGRGSYGIRGSRRGAMALKFPNGGFATAVWQSGTRGKGFWQKSLPEITRVVPAVIAKEWKSALRQEFI